MNFSEVSKKRRLVAFAILAIIIIFTSVTIGYLFILQTNDVRYQTSKIMEKVPLDCYLFYPDLKYKQPNSIELTYYKEIGVSLNESGMKYPFTFMRSAAFHGYLIEHCPMLNQSKSIKPPEVFNGNLTEPNNVTLSQSWIDSIKSEQAVHDYNLGPFLLNNTDNSLWNLYANYYNENLVNPKHFNKIEQGAYSFNMTLPQFTDQFFLPWNDVLDVNKYQNVTGIGMFNEPSFIGCKNPSWRANSNIQQCDWWQSHWVINVHTQELMGILDVPPPVKPKM